jgi:hypothetical protein
MDQSPMFHQKAATFNLDEIMRQMTEGHGSK